jgi:hypothetical protein
MSVSLQVVANHRLFRVSHPTMAPPNRLRRRCRAGICQSLHYLDLVSLPESAQMIQPVRRAAARSSSDRYPSPRAPLVQLRPPVAGPGAYAVFAPAAHCALPRPPAAGGTGLIPGYPGVLLQGCHRRFPGAFRSVDSGRGTCYTGDRASTKASCAVWTPGRGEPVVQPTIMCSCGGRFQIGPRKESG